ncbi:MAG: sulfurtransferase [Planctomycetaceae bacterium]|nr:sulfurtransferase [Planctomycetales bacterium]MCB9923257.1 sulfurtransferase [Planctomycetaceae bacterium]
MHDVVNIAAYKFVPLDDLKELRRRLRKRCVRWGLMGTILLSTEGINLFVAGSRSAIDKLLVELRGIPGLHDLPVKESFSDQQPFNRMLVRIKQEIIAFGVDGIAPLVKTSPKLAARELKQWLDEGRPVTLLDTRNDYEVKLGTFRNALPIGVDHFRDFPEAVRRLPAEMKEQPVVMFCTGGIRCEKAGPFMEREGFKQIFQLDGGILKYFEECGGDHYDGDCFVFDQRVALDSRLRETDAALCFACQEPLTVKDQQSPKYIPGQSCPYCFKEPEEWLSITIEQRHAAIQAATTPLPGSQPYQNKRPIKVPQRFDGFPFIEFLVNCLPHVPRYEWQAIFDEGFMVNADGPVLATRIVYAGERFHHVLPGTIEPDVNPNIQILFEDKSIIVVNKPAPLPIHPCGQFNRNTLMHIMAEAYRPERPRVAHRLDSNTTGIVVMSRTRHMAGLLQPQFERREVDKTYLARVHGHPVEDVFRCEAPISIENGAVGVRTIDPKGLESLTEFRTLLRLDDGSSFVEARPITGRTNQIRLHLWHLNLPIVGDPLYLPNQQVGPKQTLSLVDPPLCLHAWQIVFTHPLSGERISFEAPLPNWAEHFGGVERATASL